MNVDNERRAGGPRVPLHTLVEIGAGEGGSAAFEAESVDVTTGGIHLRTAYLPELGEPLVCRFEGNGSEIVVQGEVAWRNEENYGGDFGVRFLEMDQESHDALTSVVGDPVADEAEASDAPAQASAPRGTRVRLHIEGLGSPMKARVREGSHGEVLVGSNLEFLRVGRNVEFENVDDTETRPARIERVSVEVEPSSHIPQLIVALRYLDVVEEARPTMTTAYAEDEGDEPTGMDAGMDEGMDEGMAEGENEEDVAHADGEYDEEAYEEEAYDEDGAYDEDAAYDDEDEEETEEEGEGRAAVVWSKVKQVGPKMAVVGSFARRWGGKAKDVVGDAVVVAKQKAAQKVQERKEAKAPRRTTAPPPKGALRGDGSRARVNVAKKESQPVKTKDKKKPQKGLPKRAAMVALVSVLLTLVAWALPPTR